MFDVGAFELFMIAIVALVVIKPQDLPAFFRTTGNFIGKVRSMANEFRYGIQSVIDEAERQAEAAIEDPFEEERKAEGVTDDMTPEEITDHIMENRKREAEEAKARGESVVEPVAVEPAPDDSDESASTEGGHDQRN